MIHVRSCALCQAIVLPHLLYVCVTVVSDLVVSSVGKMDCSSFAMSSSKKRRVRAAALRHRLWVQQQASLDVANVKQDYILHRVEQIYGTLLHACFHVPMYAPCDVDRQDYSDATPIGEIFNSSGFTESKVGAASHITETVPDDEKTELLVDNLVSLVVSPIDVKIDDIPSADEAPTQVENVPKERTPASQDGSTHVENDPNDDGVDVTCSVEEELCGIADQLSDEASIIHNWIGMSKNVFTNDSYRCLLAHSAALIGKSKKLHGLACESKKSDFFLRTHDFVDCRDEFLQKAMEIAKADMIVSVNPGLQSSIATLSQRLGQHQRIRPPRPTTKTKRPKSHSRRKK